MDRREAISDRVQTGLVIRIPDKLDYLSMLENPFVRDEGDAIADTEWLFEEVH